MRHLPLPDIVAAVDWSTDAPGRQLVVARRNASAYCIERSPCAVPDPRCVFKQIREVAAESQGTAFVGFDFPIGLPRAWAKTAGVQTFRGGLDKFGGAGWEKFFEVTNTPSLKQPFGPASFTADRLSRIMLAQALGFRHELDLFRRCDHKTDRRQRAEAMFYTTFARQVGRSVCQAWPELIQPLRDQIRMWPFDGSLGDLLETRGEVIAEIYPAEAVAQLGLQIGPGTKRSKTRKTDRQQVAAPLRAHLEAYGVLLSDEIAAALAEGFECDDAFDAFVGLIAMIRVLRGHEPPDPPHDDAVLAVEGWMLGRDHSIREPAYKPLASLRDAAERSREAYFIERIACGPDAAAVINLAVPEAGRGSVNVLCGLNNSGKSFLLDQVNRILRGKAHNVAVSVYPMPRSAPAVLFLGKISDTKRAMGIVNLDISINGLVVPTKQGDYRRSALSFLTAQVAPYIDAGRKAEGAINLADEAVRQQIASAFTVEKEIYRCNSGDPLVRDIERLLDGTLYFRCASKTEGRGNWQFEFVALYEDGSTVPFSEWSDGLQACFYILVILAYARPDIVLFDEIENHLHPAFISELLDVLRKYPAQAIVATHHPHLIISRFADRVFYIDTLRPGPHKAPPPTHTYSKRYVDPEFKRVVRVLDDDLQRISAAYRLFLTQDDQLMRHASYLRGQASLALLHVLNGLFGHTAVGETSRSVPDTQTLQLADVIRASIDPREGAGIRVLDLGAGIGRQVFELGKLSSAQLGARVQWTCFDPIQFKTLKERLKDIPNVSVVQDTKALGTVSFDLCVMANVLHELTPREFAELLQLADARTAGFGGIVILELYPLPHPERFAVAYDQASMEDILIAAGLLPNSGPVPLRGSGATAYCTVARRRQGGIGVDPAVVQAAVESAWEQVRVRSLSTYASLLAPKDLGSYQRLLSTLTTIASIEAWRSGTWQPTAKLCSGAVSDDLQ